MMGIGYLNNSFRKIWVLLKRGILIVADHMETIFKNRSLAGIEDKVLGLEEYNKLVGLPEIREEEKKYKAYGEEIAADFSVRR